MAFKSPREQHTAIVTQFLDPASLQPIDFVTTLYSLDITQQSPFPTCNINPSATTPQLQDHVDRAPRLDIVVLEVTLIAHLLATVDQSDLFNLDALFLLKCL